MMADNALSTLFKIVLFQQDGGATVQSSHLTHFLESLPLKVDFDEAQACHTLLLN